MKENKTRFIIDKKEIDFIPENPAALVEELKKRASTCSEDLNLHFYTGYMFALSDVMHGLIKMKENIDE